MTRAAGMLKMSQLAERSGVSAGTIKHYLREGLLGGGDTIVRTSRNMAWYAPELVDRIKLIKRLQEERFMPLKLIRGMIESDPERMQTLVELEDRILEQAAAARESERMSAAEVRRRFDLPANVLDRLAELEILSPTSGGYEAEDVLIIKAISRFRARGYDETLGYTVYDTLRYHKALAPVIEEEVRLALDRLAGEVAPERAVEILAAGAEPLRDLLGAMVSKQLLAELRRQRRR
jgi:DNA-binding transcriptional MerR regulator